MAPTQVSEERCPLIQSKTEVTRPHERSNEDVEGQCHEIRDQRSRITRYLLALCIMFVELCERLTFYGVTVNMVFYCQNVLMLSSPLPSTIALSFQGTCFFLPIIGGYLADAKFGRYNTIYGSSLLYLLGIILLTATTYNYPADYALSLGSKAGFLAVALILIAIGTGGIKPNVSLLGADQVKDEGQNVTQTFFSWYFFFIITGALLAFTVVSYIQQELSFFYGYLVSALSMILAIVLLLVGRKYYLLQPPQGSIVEDSLGIVWTGLRYKLFSKHSKVHTHWLDAAKFANGGKFADDTVEGVKSVTRIFPIFLTSIPYWAALTQVFTSYPLQASYLNVKITDNREFPASGVIAFDIVATLIAIPVLDRIVYPGFRRLGFNLTPLRRMVAGYFCGVVSVILAGVIEIARKEVIKRDGTITQNVFGKSVNASSMSVFYQVPQYFLNGMSEALAVVTSMEFAYTQSPPRMRGVIMGIGLAVAGSGFYLAALLVSTVKRATDGSWYPADLNSGSLEYFMFLLAGMGILNIAVLICLAVKYQYSNYENEAPDSNKDGCGEHSAGNMVNSGTLSLSLPLANYK